MNPFRLTQDKPSLFLAPMEGVTDAPMRTLITEVTSVTHCVSEFLRVTTHVPSPKAFLEHAVELKNGSRTPSGVPLVLQLLGGDPEKLAETALRAVSLGAQAIDLNFGCPAPTVNRHDGGAALLKCPDRIYTIIKTLRDTLPVHIPVSAKVRLGFDNPDDIYRNAEMAFKAGTDWLTIHARTRNQGYRPPIFWQYIADINKNTPVPIVANGDIWSLDDFKRCRDLTGCQHFMLGRGLFVNPMLANFVASELGLPLRQTPQVLSDEQWRDLFLKMFTLGAQYEDQPRVVLHRVKQWLGIRNFKQPTPCFDIIKRLQTPEAFFELSQNIHNFDMGHPAAMH